MNRPSLLARSATSVISTSRPTSTTATLARGMVELFKQDCRCGSCCIGVRTALDIYFSSEQGPARRFTVLTAASDAVFDPDIRAMVQSAVREMDRVSPSSRLRRPKANLRPTPTPRPASLLTATIHRGGAFESAGAAQRT